MLGIGQRTVTGSQATHPPAPASSRARWRYAAFAVLLVIYAALTLLVVVRNGPTMRLDEWVANLRMKHRWPGPYDWINFYIHIGQRAPSTAVALPWIIWRCRRLQSKTPIVRLVVALLLLNVSVGIVKVATGRIGPHKYSHADAVFAGGNIYPSGHVSNIVVLLGVLSWMAVRYRRAMIITSIIVPITVGFSTIYLNMHWLTDVIGGWLAGGLVLLALPSVMPTAERWADAIELRLRRAVSRRRARRARRTAPPDVEIPALPASAPASARASAPLSASAGDPAAAWATSRERKRARPRRRTLEPVDVDTP